MRFGILGPLLARVGGRDVRFDGPRQAKMLAALLIEANQIVLIPRLVAVMWDREGPATAARQVQDAVSGVRRILTAHGAPPDLISTHRGGYRIGLETAELDVFDFEQQVSNAEKYFTAGDAVGAVGALRQAIGLWRSDALADIASTAVAAQAAQLNGRRIAVHRQCLEIELMLGRHHGIVEELTGLVGAHPFDEGLAELAMLALERCGRRADALALYRDLRSRFQTELGIEPNPALQQLHQDILTEAAEPFVPDQPEPPAAADKPSMAVVPTPRQLPRGLADFTGRESALDCVRSALTDMSGDPEGLSAVAVVTGAGGFGKSSLAIHAGHQLADVYTDGQLYADLGGTSPRPADPHAILARFVRSLAGDGVSIPADTEEAAAVFRSLVAGRRILVVLDDARDCHQVEPLLPAASGCAVLITSRSRLQGLDSVCRVDLDGLDDADARALLARIAGRTVLEGDLEALGDVVRACGGSPLAIRIAGSRLAVERGLSPRVLADRLADPARRLDEFTIAGRSVRTGLAAAGLELHAAAVRVLGLLGLWPGAELSLEAAAALVGLPVQECRPMLDVLVDRHLLECRRPGRYGLHDLMRLYAAESVTEPVTDRGTAIGRIAVWYLRNLSEANEAIGTPDVGSETFESYHDALAWLDLEHRNLVEAVRSAQSWGHHATAWRLAVGLEGFFLLRHHMADWTTTLEMVQPSAAAVGDDALARVLTSRGNALIEVRDFDGAERCVRKALAMHRGAGNVDGRTASLIALGRACAGMGRFAEAIGTLEEATISARQAADAWSGATALAEKGHALSRVGYQDAAIASYRDALALLPAPGSREEGVILGFLGAALLATGDPDEAIRCHEQALAVRRQADDRLLQADSLLAIGDILDATGRTAGARDAWTAAADLYEALVHPRIGDVRERLRSAIPAG
jgi:DNA-binding SARP family transcriptional activator/tetratricopeptide (TPR) repeat protein